MRKIFLPALISMMTISLGALLHAQSRSGDMQGAAASDAARDPLRDLRFRNLGPAVAGGRVAAVAGVPGNPQIMYVGAAGGGMWKTTDGGISWRAIWDNMPTASIGSIALAPQNPNWVWVGTGEGNPRNDVLDGRGIFFSSDAGATWKRMGLETTGQIPVVIVSPADSNTIYAASLGHVWAANSDRGVFRSTDGGKSWQKVLFVNDSTGASDLVMDPRNPKILYAGMWQVARHPWILESGGAASGVYRTTDGGDTWQKLSNGLPTGNVGRIGVAVAPGNPQHVYALVESRTGVLWESRDGGDRWSKVSDDRSIQARPFYFSHLYVPQNDEDRIYFLSYDILLSTDAGRTSHIIARGVHPDHHSLWIDPRDPAHLIEGNDGGIYVSMDAGDHWRYLDNLPIEQYYSVAFDDRVPYTVCGGLQDNNGWCGPSASLKGSIGPSDWQTYVGGDGQYVVPGRNGNPYVYGDSQGGAIVRTNRETDESAFVRPYNLGVGDEELGKLKYRFNWTSPIAISPKDSNEVYLGGNFLFRSKDAGAHWEPISSDLTRNDKSKQVLTGGPILYDLSNAENYDTILSISISPVDPNVIWVGTDDGCIQVTRDGGAHWSNTASAIAGLPEWGRISQVDSSPSSAGTAYASVDFHEMDNSKPYVFKTEDYGKTWTSITGNLPQDSPVHVVREDPNQKGLLIAGSDTGLFYSTNASGWHPLHAGFPTAPVFDLQFAPKSHDLIVATHGRGMFILDNIAPLEHAEMASGAELRILPITPATRWMPAGRGGGFSLGGFTTPNPPNGAVIDYFAPQGSATFRVESGPNESTVTAPAQSEGTQSGRGGRGGASIVITDASGKTVRKMNASARAGFNRAVWPLTYDPPTPLDFIRGEGAGAGEEGGGGRGGTIPVAPGTYHVAVTIGDQTQKQDFRVEPDPRVKTNAAGFAAATQTALEARDTLNELDSLLNRMEATRAQLRGLARPGGNQAIADRARELEKKIAAMEDPLYNSAALTDSKAYLHYLSRLHDRLTRVAGQVAAGYGEGPKQMDLDELKELDAQVKKNVGDFNQLLAADGAAFNKFAAEQGVQAIAISKQ